MNVTEKVPDEPVQGFVPACVKLPAKWTVSPPAAAKAAGAVRATRSPTPTLQRSICRLTEPHLAGRISTSPTPIQAASNRKSPRSWKGSAGTATAITAAALASSKSHPVARAAPMRRMLRAATICPPTSSRNPSPKRMKPPGSSPVAAVLTSAWSAKSRSRVAPPVALQKPARASRRSVACAGSPRRPFSVRISAAVPAAKPAM